MPRKKTSKTRQTVAIVGLGRIGGFFLEQMLCLQEREVEVVAVCDPKPTPARSFAQSRGIPVLTLEEVASLGGKADIVFELTGDPKVRKLLPRLLHEAGNTHTAFVPESVARLMEKFVSEHPIPRVDRG